MLYLPSLVPTLAIRSIIKMSNSITKVGLVMGNIQVIPNTGNIVKLRYFFIPNNYDLEIS